MLLDESSNGQVVEIPIGETIEIHLPENPTTGFRWRLTGDGSPACNLIRDDFRAPSGPPGKGGIHAWTFEAMRAGNCDIELRYRRRWETRSDHERTFTIHVRVRNGSEPADSR
jgi:inhibitor of cysteine peptidase